MSVVKTIDPIFDVILKEDDLEHLESRLGVKLPQDYKIFMMLHNGGKPMASVFNFVEHGDQTSASVRRFFALDDSHKFYSLNKHISIYHGRHPPGMVPVACDSFEEPGGTIEKIEGGHLPPNPHTYPRINYTTESGAKGTICIDWPAP